MADRHLLLLHGALGSSAQMAPLAARLGEGVQVHVLDFEGHGAAPPPARPFRMAGFAANILSYLDARGVAQADAFGYSMGGYAALCLAAESLAAIGHPARICVGDRDELVTLEESVATYRALPAGELAVLPATPHPFERVDLAVLGRALEGFFGG